jgi:hypothetical protein
MNNNSKLWMGSLAGSLMIAASAHSAEPAPQLERVELNSTNRLTASLRFGLNIKGKFKLPGGGLNPRGLAANGRLTPDHDRYNYDDGYVLTDNTGNLGGQTWYWGHENAGQVNASGPDSIDFHRTTATGLPSECSGDDSPYVGAEIAYVRELGVHDKYHPLHFGLEGAFNYMPVNFTSGGNYRTTLNQRTDTYSYTHGTTPPSAPYHGTYSGPGFLLGDQYTTSTTLTPGTLVQAQQHFYANLWGFRLGPYLETSLTEKLALHLSGGVSLGIVDARADWRETVILPGGGGFSSMSGSGTDASVMWGCYVGADAVYRFNERWALDVGIQFQDLGIYKHNFAGREAELDLSRSLFIQAGISYSF